VQSRYWQQLRTEIQKREIKTKKQHETRSGAKTFFFVTMHVTPFLFLLFFKVFHEKLPFKNKTKRKASNSWSTLALSLLS